VTEMDPEQLASDNLLRRFMSAPVPSLPPNFEQRVLGQLRRASEPFDRYSRMLLTGYGLTSAVASAAVMRGQGLNWGAISLLILGPLALLAAMGWARRLTRTSMIDGAKQG
jgi:hypothetical protein